MVLFKNMKTRVTLRVTGLGILLIPLHAIIPAF